MSLLNVINRLRPLVINKNIGVKINFSVKTIGFGDGSPDVKKIKRPIIPKITLLSSDNVTVTTLEDAQKISRRRDLKLVKVIDVDAKTQRPIYKLMTGSEYHAEDLKQREERKKERLNSNVLKGEKVLILSSNISEHDLKTHINKIIKWLNKHYEVRVVINGDANNSEKAENVYTFLETSMKTNCRFLQKRQNGNDLKFQILPPKKENSSS